MINLTRSLSGRIRCGLFVLSMGLIGFAYAGISSEAGAAAAGGPAREEVDESASAPLDAAEDGRRDMARVKRPEPRNHQAV